MIYCIAQFKPKSGREEELIEKLKGLRPLTIQEKGCIQYDVTKVFKNKYADSGTNYPIVFNEQWDSVEAFEEHCEKDYIVNFFKKECLDFNGCVESWKVNTFEKI